jgi:hypothetical protein
MTIHKSIDFNALPLEDREAFIGQTASPSPRDGPILKETKSLLKNVAWNVALVCFLAFLVLSVLAVGFGIPGQADALHGSGMAIFLFILLAPACYSLLSTWRLFRLRKDLPYTAGKYLFAWDLVDAQGKDLKIFPLAQLSDLRAVHQHYYGMFSHTRFTFKFKSGPSQTLLITNRKTAEVAIDTLRARQAEMNAAVAQSDRNTLRRLDPFLCARMADWKLGDAAGISEKSTAKALPKFFRWRAVWATGIAMALILAGLPLRNLLSDEAQYSAVKKSGTEKAYAAYMSSGWRHKAEIEADLPKVAYSDARKAGTVTAFRGVLKRYPKSGLDAEARKEIAAIYRKAFERFREEAATSDPTLIPFMETMLTTLEAEGNPTLQLRFKRPSPESLAAADAKIRSSQDPLSVKTVAPLAPHFSSNSAEGRERRITAELGRAFKAIFPNDVLKVSATGEPDPRLPVFDISYDLTPSGVFYSQKDGIESLRLFSGIIVRFDATLSLAGAPSARQMKFEVHPPDSFKVKSKDAQSNILSGHDDGNIYVTMADRAFDQLGIKLRSAFFNTGSRAFKQSSGI